MCLRHLGDRCCRCDYRDLRAIQFDHIAGDGWRLRKNGPKGKYTVGWNYGKAIIAAYNNGTLKEKYQLLCANCNQIKRREKGEFRRRYDWGDEPEPQSDQMELFSELQTTYRLGIQDTHPAQEISQTLQPHAQTR
jgi:cytochrome c1